MSLKCRNILFVLLMSYLCEAACQSTISSDVCAAIGDRFRIQIVSSNPLLITWQRSDKITGINSYPTGSDCRIEDTTIYNLTRYAFTCDSNVYRMHIKKTSIVDLNKSWYVKVYDDIYIQPYTTDVRLCVPVVFVNMIQTSDSIIDMVEGVSEIFKCDTSASWPQATVTWYKREPNTTNEYSIDGNITATYTSTGEHLYITNSSLSYNPTREEQSYRIYCKANSTDETSVVSLNQPQINILYVPNYILPVIQGYGDSCTLIEHSTLNITCVINGGNPRPILTWICNDGTVTEENNGIETKVRIVWRAERNKDGPCTCISYHPLVSTNKSDTVNIEILYGPQTPPSLTYTYSSGESGILSTPFNVVENSSLRITCENSNSRPMSTYTWIGHFESDSGVLDATAIHRSANVDSDGTSFYECTCIVRNTMVNTCGVQRTETGTRNRTQRVNVLFPASLDSVSDRSVLEGNTFNLQAHVRYHGSPRESYTWFYNKTQSSSKTELVTDLTHTITNISRLSAGFYTIEATNQISPTGFQTYTAVVTQTFYLNVFYKTSIYKFKIDGQDGNVTVNESTQVALLCTVDSNPASYIHLHALTYNGENSLAQSTLTYTLEYMLQTATCYDTGVYVCNGENNYTFIPAVERSYLFVRCTPRPRYPVNNNITLYSALGESVTLNMTVIAYPIPSPRQFTWVKINGQSETVIITEPNTNITTVDLDTQLTIKQLNQTNFGQYKLTIQYSDTGASYIHYFFIAPKDKPQRPTQFINIEERVSDTTAYFEWTPGFDGGLPQTFYILYKTHADSIWSHKSVAGSNTTLTELIPNTLYYVKIHANNELGNSSETTVLNITTTRRTDVLKPSDSSFAAVGGIVGGVSALIIIVVVVVVIIRRRKGGNDSKEHGYETPQSRTMSSENDDAYNTLQAVGQVHSDHNTYYNLDRNPYEDLKRDNDDNHEYGTLNISDDTEINGKISDDKMYENLRLSPVKLE